MANLPRVYLEKIYWSIALFFCAVATFFCICTKITICKPNRITCSLWLICFSTWITLVEAQQYQFTMCVNGYCVLYFGAVFDNKNTIFVRKWCFPPTIFMFSSYSVCHHLSVTQEYSLINKGKSLDPNLNIVKGKAALFDIFFQTCLYLCDGIYLIWHFCCLSIIFIKSHVWKSCWSEVMTARGKKMNIELKM